MNDHDGPVYEVSLSIDRVLALDVDEWLAGHVGAMLEVDGITAARSYSLDDDGERVRRVTCYYFDSEASLQRYLDTDAAQLRQHTVDKFGDGFEASRRILRTPTSAAGGPVEIQHCLNCDAILTGQYCGNCGQRASSRLISILQLLKDAFGDLFELDSRLWRTVIPLAIRPGQLTRDYLQGRRARFMPPFRMYIVLSLAFFLIAFFDAREELGILFEPLPPEQSQSNGEIGEALDEIREGLEQEGVVINDSEDERSFSVTVGDDDENGNNCEFDDYDAGSMPPWLGRRLTKDRVTDACERVLTNGESGMRGFADKVGGNIPVGLFVLLPVMALILKALYPLSRRYYVEHLLFVVHYHAFIFLALSIQILFSRSILLVGLPNAIGDFVGLVLSAYIPIYLYKSLRRVYQQGRIVTFLKLIILFIAYAIGLTLILLFAAFFAAFSA